MAIEINDVNFEEVLQGGKPVLVDFWAAWCGPCRALATVIDQLFEYYGERVVVAKYNLEVAQTYAQKYAVRSIPTVILFSQGEIVKQWVGVQSESTYREEIDTLLG